MTSHTREIATKRMAGFTLVELAIVVAIMAIVMGMAVPAYQNIIASAEVNSAISDIETISKAIDLHLAQTGELPETLDDVGLGEMIDPWGSPYQYLPLAVDDKDADLVELSDDGEKVIVDGAMADAGQGGSDGAGSASGGVSEGARKGLSNAPQSSDNSLSKVSFDLDNGKTIEGRSFDAYRRRMLARANASGEIALNELINPATTAPSTFEFVVLSRKDLILEPLNRDYDLFSMGPNGDSDPSVYTEASEDDIIRAYGGKFIGPATNL